MGWPAYQPAGRCTGSTPPGSNAFMAWAVGDFRQGARNYGIYNCRDIRGKTTNSLHGEGRAVDVGFSGVANPAGTRLLNALLPHVGTLGIQMIIWNRRIYSARYPRGASYNGVSPHTDHLHIELTWNAARNLTRDRVRQVVGGGGAPAPKPIDWAAVRRWNAGLVYNNLVKLPNLDANSKPSMQIAVLQQALNVVGGAGLKEDGHYGPATINAVLRFQKWMTGVGVDMTADYPGAAWNATRWWLAVGLANIRDGKG